MEQNFLVDITNFLLEKVGIKVTVQRNIKKKKSRTMESNAFLVCAANRVFPFPFAVLKFF